MATMFPQTLGQDVDPYEALIAAQRAKVGQPMAPMFTPEQQAQRLAQNQREYEVGLLGLLSGDEVSGNVGNQVLRQALAARAPRITEKGTADQLRGTFQYSPDYLRQQDEEKLAGLERARAGYVSNRQAAEAAARERRERDAEKFENQKELRMLMRTLGGQGGGGSFQPSAFTPSGEQIVTNSKTGLGYTVKVGPNGQPVYTPYTGVSTPKATFDKAVVDAEEKMASAQRADRLIKAVEGNPGAFGLKAAAVGMLPGVAQGWVGRRIANLTSEQMNLRAQVTRDAAMELNAIYGAAQSAGELARAAAWAPNASDDFETIITKLQSARDWAMSGAKRYGPGVVGAAQGRAGVRDTEDGAAADPLGLRR